MDYRSYVSGAKIKTLKIIFIIFILFIPSINCYADVSDTVTGSLLSGYTSYIPVNFYDKTDSLTISCSITGTFTAKSLSTGSRITVTAASTAYFYDSDYSELYRGVVCSSSGSLTTTNSPYSLPASGVKTFTAADIPDLNDVAYVRIYSSLSSGTTYSSVFKSGSYSIYGEGTVRTVIDAVDEQTEVIKQQHQEEIDSANKAASDVTQGVGQVTDVLSSWEILTLPVTVTRDIITAITSEGSTGITFPSFSIMGHEVWPSYTFDLMIVADKFPLLYNSLHVISGIILVSWFIHYLWRKWHILTGDDTPEGS